MTTNTPDTEMVERVSCVIAKECGADPYALRPVRETGHPVDQHNHEDDPCYFEWRDFTGTTRLVLEAMKEPTDEMRIAGLIQLGKGRACFEKEPIDIWQVMISAALNTEGGK